MNIKANVKKQEKDHTGTVGYATLTVENCCVLRGAKIKENEAGELYAVFPNKPVMENGVQKLRDDGQPMYRSLYLAVNSEGKFDAEIDKAIKDLMIRAYESPEGYAFINPTKGEATKARIDAELSPRNHETIKASGSLLIGGYLKVNDVTVNLRTAKENGDAFLAVSYPGYNTDKGWQNYVEPMKDGKLWDHKAKAEKSYNFKEAIEGVMEKKTREFHPELSKQSKEKVDDLLADAKAKSEKANKGETRQAEQERSK